MTPSDLYQQGISAPESFMEIYAIEAISVDSGAVKIVTTLPPTPENENELVGACNQVVAGYGAHWIQRVTVKGQDGATYARWADADGDGLDDRSGFTACAALRAVSDGTQSHTEARRREPAPAPADAKTYVAAAHALGAPDVTALERPETLVLGPLGGSLAEVIVVQGIDWSNWGQSIATGRGRHKTKTYDPWTRVEVRAFGLRTCESEPPFHLYTRVETTAYGRTTDWDVVDCMSLTG